MVTNRTQVIVGLWLVGMVILVTACVALGAHWSTTVIFSVMGAAPMGVALLLGLGGSRSMTTREMMHAIDTEK